MGKAVADHRGRKILILNGFIDRETEGMTAAGFVWALAKALNYSLCLDSQITQDSSRELLPRSFVTHLICHADSEVLVDSAEIESLGIELVRLGSKEKLNSEEGRPLYHPDDLVKALCRTIEGAR